MNILPSNLICQYITAIELDGKPINATFIDMETGRVQYWEAGKQVEAAGTAHMRGQPVEDGLLDAIRGGSESVHIPDRQFTALPLAADDSYHARSPLGGWALARAVTAGFHSGHRVSSSENKVVV